MGLCDVALIDVDVADTSGYYGERECALREVLWFGQDAAGGVATGDQGILGGFHEDVDTISTKHRAGLCTLSFELAVGDDVSLGILTLNGVQTGLFESCLKGELEAFG